MMSADVDVLPNGLFSHGFSIRDFSIRPCQFSGRKSRCSLRTSIDGMRFPVSGGVLPSRSNGFPLYEVAALGGELDVLGARVCAHRSIHVS